MVDFAIEQAHLLRMTGASTVEQGGQTSHIRTQVGEFGHSAAAMFVVSRVDRCRMARLAKHDVDFYRMQEMRLEGSVGDRLLVFQSGETVDELLLVDG